MTSRTPVRPRSIGRQGAVRWAAVALCAVALWGWPGVQAGYGWYFWSWLVGALVLAISLPGPSQRTARPSPAFLIGLVLLLGLAAALRLPQVAEIPPNVSVDEVLPGYEAWRIAQGRTGNVFSSLGWFTIPNLSFALPGAVMAWWPGDVFEGLRLSSVLTGLFGIVGMALLCRRLQGEGAALTAAFLMATGFWHLHNSRTGFPFVQTSFGVSWVLYAVLRARQTSSWRGFFVAGLALGLALQLYFPVRILVLLVPLFLVVGWIERRDSWRQAANEACWLAAGAAWALAPLLSHAEWASLLGRSQGVLLTRPAVFEQLSHLYGVDGLPAVLWRNTQESLGMLWEWADVCILNRSPDGLFDRVTLAAIALGALVAICQARAVGLLLLAWIGMVFVLGVALTDAPRASYRLGPAMPAFYMLAAFGVHSTVLAALPRVRWYRLTVLPAVFAGFASAVVLENYDNFFVDYVRKGDGRAMPASAAMRHAGARCPGRSIYFLASPEPLGREPMLEIFCPRHRAIDASEIPDRIDATQPATLIVMSWQRQSLARIQQCYPGAEEVVQRSEDGRYLFTSIDLEVDTLVAGQASCPREAPRKGDQLGASLGAELGKASRVAGRATVPRPALPR